MVGLKRVRNRRGDALANVGWDRLEALLAEYYAGLGYRVEHVGTGGTGQRFDGGIDLKLRKDEEYILVQCKGWNAYQVPHNEVHQLIGLVVNESATGAILVTSGEFTQAALDAAAKGGHVQLVDGDALRGMLGPVLAGLGEVASEGKKHGSTADVRRSSRNRDRSRVARTAARRGGLGRRLVLGVISTAVFLLVVMFAVNQIRSGVASLAPGSQRVSASVSVPAQSPTEKQSRESAPVDAPSSPRKPTEAEIRESQRKAEEAMKVIEATTPEV